MVRGLERFKEHFQDYTDSYILIGGTACFLVMDKVGEEFRVTKDLDIVLCVEALSADFGKAFWNFVRAGRYKNQQRSTGKTAFYRFYEPEDDTFPVMLELFSTVPDSLEYEGDSHLVPIPMADDVSSLSAILLDEGYYFFLHSGKQVFAGLSIVGPEHLIPLKAKAWLDLSARRQEGERIDEKQIRKHRNDVFRLFRIISPDSAIVIPPQIRADLKQFIDKIAEVPINLKAFGYRGMRFKEVLSELNRIYRLND